MGKTATLNLRVNPDVKENAESVLEQLGIPMATAIDMYLKQISLVGGIPFSVVLPKAVLRVLPVRIAVSNQYQLRLLPLPKSGIHRRIRKYIKLDRDCCPQIQIFH